LKTETHVSFLEKQSQIIHKNISKRLTDILYGIEKCSAKRQLVFQWNSIQSAFSRSTSILLPYSSSFDLMHTLMMEFQSYGWWAFCLGPLSRADSITRC